MSDQPIRAHTSRLRERNNNWKGGRLVASNGYVLIRVGVGHHLADVRGYAYEHRVVAEEKIGRKLADGELVHHIDEDKKNNSPENLKVVSGNAEHFVHHRKKEIGLRLPGENNSLVDCACGCGEIFPKYDKSGRPRKFASGHNGPNFLRGLIICYLENVPEIGTSRFISEMIDANEGSVRNALAKLKKQGIITRDAGKFGEWRLANV